MIEELAKGLDSSEPLASRDGMVREVLESAKHYPLIFVVVNRPLQVESLQQLFLVSKHAVLGDKKVVLPGCEVHFGSALKAECFRGTVPVFCDPTIYRTGRAA